MPKTKRFYYFTPTKYALEAVKNRRLKVAELDKANDPYEILPARWNSNDEDKAFQDMKNKIAARLKMVCLSKTYKNPSLWGHYADKCKGICLGFDIKTYGDDSKDIISRIKYKKYRMDMNKFGLQYIDGEFNMNEDESDSILRYKSHHWKHEKEWRIWVIEEYLELDPITGLYFNSFSDQLKLREILIGFRCEEENIERRFEKLINDDDNKYPDPKPKIIRTRLSSCTFEIETEEKAT